MGGQVRLQKQMESKVIAQFKSGDRGFLSGSGAGPSPLRNPTLLRADGVRSRLVSRCCNEPRRH